MPACLLAAFAAFSKALAWRTKSFSASEELRTAALGLFADAADGRLVALRFFAPFFERAALARALFAAASFLRARSCAAEGLTLLRFFAALRLLFFFGFAVFIADKTFALQSKLPSPTLRAALNTPHRSHRRMIRSDNRGLFCAQNPFCRESSTRKNEGSFLCGCV